MEINEPLRKQTQCYNILWFFMFNWLNFMGHVAGTEYLTNSCFMARNTIVQMDWGTCRCYMTLVHIPQHFHGCVHVVIMLLLHIPATYPHYTFPRVLQSVILLLLHVSGTCHCFMAPSVRPPLWWVSYVFRLGLGFYGGYNKK